MGDASILVKESVARRATGHPCACPNNVMRIERRRPEQEPPPEDRPQDEWGDGSGLRFELLSFGGEYDDNMPMSIRVTDTEGHSCVYVPITVDGRVVDSKRFTLERLSEPTRKKSRLFAGTGCRKGEPRPEPS